MKKIVSSGTFFFVTMLCVLGMHGMLPSLSKVVASKKNTPLLRVRYVSIASNRNNNFSSQELLHYIIETGRYQNKVQALVDYDRFTKLTRRHQGLQSEQEVQLLQRAIMKGRKEAIEIFLENNFDKGFTHDLYTNLFFDLASQCDGIYYELISRRDLDTLDKYKQYMKVNNPSEIVPQEDPVSMAKLLFLLGKFPQKTFENCPAWSWWTEQEPCSANPVMLAYKQEKERQRVTYQEQVVAGKLLQQEKEMRKKQAMDEYLQTLKE